jgi:hypothetical protein
MAPVRGVVEFDADHQLRGFIVLPFLGTHFLLIFLESSTVIS